uniref:Uncharacterized protein orf1 n=1 Tax=Beta vulgaris subsp. maritima TaxID=350892 RepID=O47882_BETVM|nr:hypothetical protein [Beta vulgaris subsp. maritima]
MKKILSAISNPTSSNINSSSPTLISNLIKGKDKLHQPSLSNAINQIESNKEVFSLTHKMSHLSLNDKSASSSNTTLTTTEEIINRFQKLSNPSTFTRNIMEKTKAPFIDILKPITSITERSSSYMMSLGFRFMPGQAECLVKDLRVPESLDALRNLRDSLGLTLTKSNLCSGPLLKLKGLSDLVANQSSMLASRVLVEAITFHSGYYGRFLVLVQMGVGCTVWYGFVSSDGMNMPTEALEPLFSPIENYDAFFTNPDIHVQPGFNKMTLAEGVDNPVKPLTQAFAEEKPFIDIEIPNTNKSLLVGVSLGLAVAILFTFGITPNSGEGII